MAKSDYADLKGMNMACKNGRVDPDQMTKYKLFSGCAGYCQNPACRRPLFLNYKKKYIHIAEMAHVIASADNGPRASDDLSEDEKAKFENLIMLCPSCHTMVDKAPDSHPVVLLKAWKEFHEEGLRRTLGIKTCVNRVEARERFVELSRANKVVLDIYGPNTDERFNPESAQPRIWTEKVVSEILPNNESILDLCKVNAALLNDDERRTVEVFRQHTKDLTLRHLHDESITAIQYPGGMDDLFAGDKDG